ncbi:MAG: XRE family transcriptional regulator [Anaerolineae bacterium]|nr:XRE family transcriptional regulator [Anaerolineae bacterium]
MAVSREVALARYAAFVRRALRDARDRGMTDQDIQRVTGVAQSTFHRWQKGDGTNLPTISRVRAFCDGLEVPLRPALIALGMDDTREPTPEPPLDPDIQRIARILRDPNVPEAEKQAIRHTIRMLSRASRSAPQPATQEPLEA